MFVVMHRGGILPQSVVAGPYEKASASSDFSANLSTTLTANGVEDISILASQRVFGQ
jgi:hypothetical protein